MKKTFQKKTPRAKNSRVFLDSWKEWVKNSDDAILGIWSLVRRNQIHPGTTCRGRTDV